MGSVHLMKVYGMEHLLTLAVILLAYFLLFIFIKKPLTLKKDKVVRYALAFGMIGLEVTFLIWSIDAKGFMIDGKMNKDLPPFELCSVIMWVTTVGLLFDKPKLIKIVAPWSIIGVVLSFSFPEMGGDYHFPQFRYIHFFGLHALFLGSIFYFFLSKKVLKYQLKDGLYSSYVLFGYAFIMMGFNYLFHYNYLFMRELPEAASFVHQFIKAPFHVFPLIVIVFGLNMLFSLVFHKIAEVRHDVL